MNSADSRSFRIALIAGQVAWMIDIVLLPLWVGGLVEGYKYSPAQANSIAMSLLISVIAASCLPALLLHRHSVQWVLAVWVAMASLCFMVVWCTSAFLTFRLLHVSTALSAGCTLSVINDAIGRPINPHRNFALATTGFVVFSIIFMCAYIQIITATESRCLFLIFLDVMAVAALVNHLLFLHSKSVTVTSERARADAPSAVGFTTIVWFLVLSLLRMNFNQPMSSIFRESRQQSRVGRLRNKNHSALCRLLQPIAVLMEKSSARFMWAWRP